MSLRRQNRLQAMRVVQAAAMDLFEVDGFDSTTIEDIARSSGVSASTIYRHFATKENLVLWDERDPVVDDELARRLRRQEPIEAFRDAVVVGLAERDDIGLFLRRLRLVYAEPAIWSAAALQDRRDRAELAEAVGAVAGAPTLEADAVAALCLLALDLALEHWQRAEGQDRLADVIDASFEALAGAT